MDSCQFDWCSQVTVWPPISPPAVSVLKLEPSFAHFSLQNCCFFSALNIFHARQSRTSTVSVLHLFLFLKRLRFVTFCCSFNKSFFFFLHVPRQLCIRFQRHTFLAAQKSKRRAPPPPPPPPCYSHSSFSVMKNQTVIHDLGSIPLRRFKWLHEKQLIEHLRGWRLNALIL